MQIIHLLPLGNRIQKQKICAKLAHVGFKVPFVVCPWVRLPNRADRDITPIVRGRSVMILANHTSLIDPLAITAMMDMESCSTTRTLLKASLHKIPFFGGICKMTGHFPVYFSSQEQGNFSVDKDRQAKVNEEVDAHIAAKGSLLLFPEGQVNADPRKLQNFRYGSIATALKHRLPLYGLILKGCDASGPKSASAGGLPTQIECRIIKLFDPLPDDGKSAAEVAAESQIRMQQEVDRFYGQASSPAASESKRSQPSEPKKDS